MAPNPATIALLTGSHPDAGLFIRSDCTPYTVPEIGQIMDATIEDLEAAIHELDVAAAPVHQDPELLHAAARLIAATPDANTLADVERLVGQPLTALLADELAAPTEAPATTVATDVVPGDNLVEHTDDIALSEAPA